MQDSTNTDEQVLNRPTNWKGLRFYQKSEALYQLTFAFCQHFLPAYGDRTVDQMVQAARSGKQNIIEGSEDGMTSSEMELKLLNVARSSIHELREDFKDYLLSRSLPMWTPEHARYHDMQLFTAAHNQLADYEPFFDKWTAEEMANIGYTLCCQIDTMMNGYLQMLANRFVTQGGIKERMHKVRTGYRQGQDERMKQLEQENKRLTTLCHEWEAKYADLKARALNAYNTQKAEIEELKKRLEELGGGERL